MAIRNVWLKSGLLLAVMAGTLSISNVLLAQPPAGAPPGGGFRGGFGGRGGGATTLANAPLDVLTDVLKLTDMQKSDIEKYQKAYQMFQQANRPDFSAGRPDPAVMAEIQKKTEESNKSYSDKIKGLLNDDQKKQVPDVLKDFKLLNGAQIPLGLFSKIKLTDDQKKKLDEIETASQKDQKEKLDEAQKSGDFQSVRQAMQESRAALQTKVNEVLTDEQKELIKTWRKDHPRPQGGRPGGAGGTPPPPAK